MATKKFIQMKTSKLEALLETASEEDKKAITEVLNARKSAAKAKQEEAAAGVEEGTETVEVEKQAATTATNSKKQKLSDEERAALAEELRNSAVNHRCQIVPFGTIEWVNGTVVGIIENKKSNNVMYSVLTDDGRRIVKAVGSQLIKILDEVVEQEQKVRGRKKTQKLDENGNPIVDTEWTDDEIEECIKAVIDNVGRTISFPEAGKMGKVEEGAPIITGRIVSLVPNKRQKTILYRVLIDGTKDKFAHKVTTAEGLVINPEIDEEGKKINEAYTTRHYKEPSQKVNLSPAEKVEAYKASLAKAEEQVEKWQKTVEIRKQKLAEAEAELAATGANQETEEPVNGEASTDDDNLL